MRTCPNCERPTEADAESNCTRCGSTPDTPVGLRIRTKRVRTLGTAAVAAMGISVLATLAQVINQLHAAALAADPSTVDAAYDSDALFYNISTLLSIPAIVLVIAWTWRTRRNLDAFPRNGQLLAPHWAIGGWVIPIANLFMPYRVVRQIVAEELHTRAAAVVTGFWWAAFVATKVFNVWIAQWSAASWPNDEAYFRAFFGPTLVLWIVYAIAGVLLSWLILSVSRAQEGRIDRMGARQAAAA